ncbi:MAG: O-methyltransferase [Chitinophagaceae bacterium]
MMNPLIEQYIEQHTSFGDEQLAEVERFTQEILPSGFHMLSGRVQGAFLYLMCKLLQPKHIIEIGTFTGYSTLCFAKSLSEGGKITTIEQDTLAAGYAQNFFNKFECASKIKLCVGKATEVLPTLKEGFDMAFVDADKINTLWYVEYLLEKINTGGCILVDNAFYHGEVIKNPCESKAGRAIQAFNEAIKKKKNIETSLISIRDGLWFIRKP